MSELVRKRKTILFNIGKGDVETHTRILSELLDYNRALTGDGPNFREWVSDADIGAFVPDVDTIESAAFSYGYLQALANVADLTLAELVEAFDAWPDDSRTPR